MTTVLHATDSAGFLALVPSLAGYTPRQSLVLLPFRESRSHGTLRMDLPGEDEASPDFVRGSLGLVSRVPNTDGIGLVVYTDEKPPRTPAGVALPRQRLIDELITLASEMGLHITETLCVTPDGWADYRKEEPGLRPLTEIPAAPLVPGIADIGGDQLSGVELPPLDPTEKKHVGKALREVEHVLERERAGIGTPRTRENPQALAAVAMLDDLPKLFESALSEPLRSSPFVTAALLWCLGIPLLRDVALIQWATSRQDGQRALDAQVRFAATHSAFPDDLGRIIMGFGPRPDPDRLRIALQVTRHAAASAPRSARQGPLVLSAWLSWALGRASHAVAYLDMADDIDPQYSMTGIVRELVDTLALPAWAFTPAAA